MNVYLIAVANKWIDDGAIVAFPIATDKPHFFGDGCFCDIKYYM